MPLWQLEIHEGGRAISEGDERYNLARALFESVPDLTAAHASAAGIDPDRGPTAAIPLHPGAARYYREREILK